MHQDRHSVHRGILITTRPYELEPTALGHPRFGASCSIAAGPPEQDALVFDTLKSAAAHALAMARLKIDQGLADGSIQPAKLSISTEIAEALWEETLPICGPRS